MAMTLAFGNSAERLSRSPKRALHELLLFELVTAHGPGGRARGLRAAHAAQQETTEQHAAETGAEVSPRAHVLRLFLHPVDGRAVVELIDHGVQVRVRQR